jgi:hypothetical protein
MIRRAKVLATHHLSMIVHLDIRNIVHEAPNHQAQADAFSGKKCLKGIVVSCCVGIDIDRGLIKQGILEAQLVLGKLSQDMLVRHPSYVP